MSLQLILYEPVYCDLHWLLDSPTTFPHSCVTKQLRFNKYHLKYNEIRFYFKYDLTKTKSFLFFNIHIRF